MKTRTQKSYIPFWSLVPILLLVSLITINKTIDINIHDTYFITPVSYISILLSLVLLISGFFYFLLEKANRKHIKTLSSIHIVSVIVFLIPFYIFLFEVIDYENNNSPIFGDLHNNNIIITFAFLIFVIGQFLVFPINILISFFRK